MGVSGLLFHGSAMFENKFVRVKSARVLAADYHSLRAFLKEKHIKPQVPPLTTPPDLSKPFSAPVIGAGVGRDADTLTDEEMERWLLHNVAFITEDLAWGLNEIRRGDRARTSDDDTTRFEEYTTMGVGGAWGRRCGATKVALNGVKGRAISLLKEEEVPPPVPPPSGDDPQTICGRT